MSGAYCKRHIPNTWVRIISSYLECKVILAYRYVWKRKIKKKFILKHSELMMNEVFEIQLNSGRWINCIISFTGNERGGVSLNFWNMVHIAASISIFLKGFAKNFI